MDRKRSPPKFIDGLSESLWKSVLVKSIRLGWPEGCRQAEMRLGRATSTSIALTQIFEDIKPAKEEIAEAINLVWKADWDKLCSYETFHGRGMVKQIFAQWTPQRDAEWKRCREDFVEFAKEDLGLKFIPPRMEANVYNWYHYRDMLKPGARRSLDLNPWKGVPIDMVDMHTYEGVKAERFGTILSGNEKGMKWLEAQVQSIGWDGVRSLIHNRPVTKAADRPYQNEPTHATTSTITTTKRPEQRTLLDLFA